MQKLSSRPLLGTRTDAALFVNRERELSQVEATVRAGFNALIRGARGAGKTSFLNQVAYRLRDSVEIMLVDGALPNDAAELLHVIRLQVSGRARKRSVGWESGPLFRTEEVMSESEELLVAVRLLRNAFSESRKAHVTVLLDGAPSPDDAHALFGRLRDELWRLPANWVVATDVDDDYGFLRPPADAFFEHIIDLEALDPSDARALLFTRTEQNQLDDASLAQIIELSKGNPRQMISLARLAVTQEKSLGSVESDRNELRRRVAEIGRPAAMLVAELEAIGPASASDERLLRRLGWTRSRASQVFKQLEEAGVVRSALEAPEGGGRPRKVFRPVGPVFS